MVIRSQARGSAIGTLEGSEARPVSSASNTPAHERPTPHVGEEMVRHPGESLGAGLNSQHNGSEEYHLQDAAHQVVAGDPQDCRVGVGRPLSVMAMRQPGELLGPVATQGGMAISSQAAGSETGTAEGSEIRAVSIASNNRPHERPAPHAGDEMIQPPGESLGSVVNSPSNGRYIPCTAIEAIILTTPLKNITLLHRTVRTPTRVSSTREIFRKRMTARTRGASRSTTAAWWREPSVRTG